MGLIASLAAVAHRLTRSRFKSLSSGVAVTLAGQMTGMIITVVSIPFLLNCLGPVRFGGLSILWMVANYAYLLDFGLSRAVTRLVSEADSLKNGHASGIIASALLLILVPGIAGGGTLYVTSEYVVLRVLNVPAGLHAEMITALRIVSFTIPLALVGAVLNGVLEARRRFGVVGLFYVFQNAVNYLAPLAAICFRNDLRSASQSIAVGRVAIIAGLWLCCFVRSDGSGPVMTVMQGRVHGFGRLASFGGWIAVSNIVAHLMILSDRALIGAMLSLEALAWYTTPLELLSRLLVIPHAFGIVLFPVFSSLSGTKMRIIAGIYVTHTKWLAGIVAGILLLCIAFPGQLLTLWLGQGVADESVSVLMILSVGIFFNALTFMPLTVIHGVGRPEISAVVHLLEYPLYIVGLWVLIGYAGIIGAAVAWSLRTFVDCVVMVMVSHGLLFKQRDMEVEMQLPSET